MAVLALFTGNITQEQYDIIRNEVDWENKHPEGGIFHAASFDEDGHVHVADVWESADHLNAFAGHHLMPAFAKHKVPPPSVSVYPTHRVIAYSAVDKFKV